MPRKKIQNPPPAIEDIPDPHEDDLPIADTHPKVRPETSPAIVRAGRKKFQNVHIASTLDHYDSSSEVLPLEATDAFPASQPLTSRHGQQTFPFAHSKPLDIKNVSEKVTDHASEYTPPSDGGLDEVYHDKSPGSYAFSSTANTPPVEPGFSSRPARLAGVQHSLAPRHGRPESLSNPYGHTGSTTDRTGQYGSPPTSHPLQSYFYNTELNHGQNPQNKETFSKLIKLPSISGGRGIATAYENNLVISSCKATSVKHVGSLHNLPGLVLDTEPLHWSHGLDPLVEFRPLVALTLLRTADTSEPYTAQQHLTVAVYSLAKGCHIADLLFLPYRAPRHYSHLNSIRHEGPDNQLSLKASENYLAVATQHSGEIHVFTPKSSRTFECLTKLWTTVQVSQRRRRQSSHSRDQQSGSPLQQSNYANSGGGISIFSMSGRWLSTCPPLSSTPSIKSYLGDSVIVNNQAIIDAHSSGSQPSINCEVDSPDADTMFTKVARNVAQEVVKAGKWMSERGSQLWQSYWDKPGQGHPGSTQTQPAIYTNSLTPGYFPPTHAEETTNKDLEVVSLFDLRALSTSNTEKSPIATPFATFKPPNGCSFMSLSPDGLMLLTASRTGEYQYVWNLLETKHTLTNESMSNQKSQTSAKVSQIARFDRLSTSVVIDVAWNTIKPGQLAVLTQNKTVHLLEIPSSSMCWPLTRTLKRPRPLSAPAIDSATFDHDEAPSGGFLASAINFASKTQPMLTSIRGNTSTTSTGLAGLGQAGIGIASVTSVKGTRAVAAGLSKSLGAATETMNRLQHAGDNKLHIKGEQDLPADRIAWIGRGTSTGICVVEGDMMRYWQAKSVSGRDARVKGSLVFDSRKPIVVRLPTLPETHQNEWTLHLEKLPNHDASHPLTHAEIDTNAQFRLFLDNRVSMLWYDTRQDDSDQKISFNNSTPTNPQDWIFGDDIPTQKMHISTSDSLETGGSTLFRQSMIRHTKN